MSDVIDYQRRLAAVQRQLRGKGLDALLVSDPCNRRYLSGYTAVDHGIEESSGLLLLPRTGQLRLLTDFRYQLQAQKDAPWAEVLLYPKGLLPLLKNLLPALGIKRLGIESRYTLLAGFQAMRRELDEKNIVLAPLEGLIEQHRKCKEAAEIELIRQSVALNERVFTDVFPTISEENTEIDIALAMEARMRQLGAEQPSFSTIVASGEHSAFPHAVPSASAIAADRPLTIDMGLIHQGYCSDMTRTFVPGQADGRYLELHRLVRRAQLAGLATLRAGVTGRQVDAAARQVISEAGYGEYFGHGLGHGVGLQVHEAPRLSPRSRKRLRAGMIVTVEPGIYIPGWGGIRLENMAVVREGGCELLNRDTTWLDI